MSFKKRIKLLGCLLLSVAAVLVIAPLAATPLRVNIYKGETYECNLFGPYRTQAVDTGDGNYRIPVTFMGMYEVKTVSVNVSDPVYLIVGGQAVGMKMHSDGPVVVGFEQIRTKDGEYDAKTQSKLRAGDRIIKADNAPCTKTADLAQIVSQKKQTPITLTVMRDEEIVEITVTPRFDTNTMAWRLGVWLRDSNAGIGTLTYTNPETGEFGALGHGICDADTGTLVEIADGAVVRAEVFDVKKGEKGNPGELRGSIKAGEKSLGGIEKNTRTGVFGEFEQVPDGKRLAVASKSQVKMGDALIRSCVDGNTVKEYAVTIEKISYNKMAGFTGMELEVCDKELLEKTGGIVQGMSGSPIIQNGKIVGAVTHVFVNDPTRGYGIFIEDMLEEAEKIR